MKPICVMLIAGEASGDHLAAELVRELRRQLLTRCCQPSSDVQPLFTGLDPEFFGAGGPRLAAEGVEVAVDLTRHAVVGMVEVLEKFRTFKRLFDQLLQLAIERQPDVIVCVDFSGFNRRFAQAVKNYLRARQGAFWNWKPKIVQLVSPQVWASREGRARKMAKAFDLILSIFPFEKEWYAARVPELKVEFIGHPVIDRFAAMGARAGTRTQRGNAAGHFVALLPGSRRAELKRHLPVMLRAAHRIARQQSVTFAMVLPNEELHALARRFGGPDLALVQVRVGDLAETLSRADVAVASTGTVTMECAFFGVPTVAIYITSWSTYQIAKRIIKVTHLAMPNLLATERLFPEFIQGDASPENIVREVTSLLADSTRRETIRRQLASMIDSLGPRGAMSRAAAAIVRLLFGRSAQEGSNADR